MKLAYIMSPSRGGTDPLLVAVARQLALRGLRLCGTVQVNTEHVGRRQCDMNLLVLPDGPALRISQDRGHLARGCRLDAGSLETAVAHVARSIDVGADLVIINKFGKHEAEGRGFRSVIATALDQQVPVLVGLNAMNREAFDNFSGGLASELRADVATVLRWVGLRGADENSRSDESSVALALRDLQTGAQLGRYLIC
jgi:nucleoside-triphosphatase THEP1